MLELANCSVLGWGTVSCDRNQRKKLQPSAREAANDVARSCNSGAARFDVHCYKQDDTKSTSCNQMRPCYGPFQRRSCNRWQQSCNCRLGKLHPGASWVGGGATRKLRATAVSKRAGEGSERGQEEARCERGELTCLVLLRVLSRATTAEGANTGVIQRLIRGCIVWLQGRPAEPGAGRPVHTDAQK